MKNQTTLSLTIIAAYMAVRAVIYHFFPLLSTYDWFVRDTVMSVPRLIGLFFAVMIVRSQPKRPDGDLSVYALAIMLFAVELIHLMGKGWSPWPEQMVIVGFATSIIVGFFEEYLFRGALFNSLLPRMGIPGTILFSSVLFTLYHFQAQSLTGWPAIFLISVVLCSLRLMGLDLVPLSILHGLIDWAYFFFNIRSGLDLPFLAMLSILAVFAFVRSVSLEKGRSEAAVTP